MNSFLFSSPIFTRSLTVTGHLRPPDQDLDEKDKRKSGVKFHPSPEVIQVASTLVTEDDTDEAASDPEIEIEVL